MKVLRLYRFCCFERCFEVLKLFEGCFEVVSSVALRVVLKVVLRFTDVALGVVLSVVLRLFEGCFEVVSSVASRDILSVVLRLFGGLFSV